MRGIYEADLKITFSEEVRRPKIQSTPSPSLPHLQPNTGEEK